MENRIRILATTDIHGTIFPYQYSDGSPVNGGTGRLKTVIDRFRDQNTLLLDNGDVLHGSSLQFYHYLHNRTDTSPITASMNALGYDYINLGNHDFDFGEEALFTHLESLRCPCITSNAIYRGQPLGPTYVVREVAGKKIAIFGLLTHYVRNWQKKQNIRRFTFKDAFATAEKTVELIRRLEKPDYIIALYHGGFERDIATGIANEELTDENQAYRILKEIQGIDVLIAGHSHTELCGTAFNTAYVQAGKNGAFLACVDIYTDTGVIEPRLLPVDGPADETVLNLAKEEEAECQKWLDMPLGTTAMDLRIHDQVEARLHKTQVITFINKIMKEASGAQLSGTSLFNHAIGFNPSVTMRDLVSTYQYSNSLIVKKINGKILREYLERTAKFWSIDQERIIINPCYLTPKLKMYYYDMIDGVDYTIRVSNDPGERIVSLTYQGEEVTDDMEFTLCLTSYRANGGGSYNMVRNAPTVKEIQTGMVELITMWILEHGVIDFEPVNNITVLK